MVPPLIPVPGRQKQEGLCKFKAGGFKDSQDYYRETVSQKTKTTNQAYCLLVRLKTITAW